MSRPLAFLKFVDGVAFELFSTLMVLNLYPLGMRAARDPGFIAYRRHRRPILLIHGLLHNKSAFFGIQHRLSRWGWTRIYMMNLATTKQGISELAKEVAKKVDSIIKKNRTQKIDIIAHSLGGIIARYYIQLLGGGQKIRHCMTLGTPHQGTLLSILGLGKSLRDIRETSGIIKKLNTKPLPKSVQFTSFWSPFDTLVIPARSAKLKRHTRNANHVKNIKIPWTGHAGLLFSKSVCTKIAAILDASRKHPDIIERTRSGLKNPLLRLLPSA